MSASLSHRGHVRRDGRQSGAWHIFYYAVGPRLWQARYRRTLDQHGEPIYLLVAGTEEPLDDAAVRSLLDNMKKLGIIRGVIVTSSSFNRAAMEFAENRSVELYHKEQLQELLKKANEAV